jgi:transposase
MAGSPLSAPKEVRFRWYLQVDRYGRSVKEVCEIFGISRKTYYKWRAKDYPDGRGIYRCRRLHPNLKLTGRVKWLIYEAKLKYNYGPNKMKLYLREHYGITVSGTIIYRYYKQRRLIRKPQKKQPWYQPMGKPFFAFKPGENVQFDVKYVPGENHTWNYQFRLTDTVTCMQFALDCLDKSANAAIHVFKEAQKYLPFPITGIQTDNGGEFRGSFAEYLNEQRIIHRFIPKRSAPWNGKVERANRSIDDEYYLNPYRPWKSLRAYVNWYNYERYHEGKNMNGLKPYQKYLQLTEVLPLNVN